MLLATVYCCSPASVSAAIVKIALFNFQASKIELSAQGTTITNMLSDTLMATQCAYVLERKELEEFLQLNDLQQKSKLDNVLNIGSRLGLEAIVLGTVEKKGTVLLVHCRVVSMEKKRVIFSKLIKTLGEENLASEISALGKAIVAAVTAKDDGQEDNAPSFSGPVNVQIRPGSGQIKLNWQPGPCNNPEIYEVFRSTNKDGPFAKAARLSVPAYLDGNLDNNVEYFYKIKVYNEDGLFSEDSAVVSATTLSAPNPPIILKAESGIKSIHLTWMPNPIKSHDPYKLEGYTIYRATSEGGTYEDVGTIPAPAAAPETTTSPGSAGLSYLDKGLGDGKVYFYKITAYNEQKRESDYSSVFRSASLPAVIDVRVEQEDIREVKLSWENIGSSMIAGYNVYRSLKETGDFEKIGYVENPPPGSGLRISYQDRNNLADSMRYYYRITAFAPPDRETSPAGIVSAQTKGKPGAPQELQARSGLLKKVELTWKPGSDGDVAGYNLYVSPDAAGEFILMVKLVDRNQVKYIDEEKDQRKLGDGITYHYRITSYNKAGIESDPVSASATTLGRPSAPLGLKGEELKVKEVPLSWQANVETDVSIYSIWRCDSAGEEFKNVARVEGKNLYVDTGLNDGVSYIYKIKAENKSGLISEFSEPVTIRTKPRPEIPQGLSGEIRSGTVYLKWQRGGEPGITHYGVYELTGQGKEKIMDVMAPLFNEKAPGKGISKVYVITAVDQDGLESDPTGGLTMPKK